MTTLHRAAAALAVALCLLACQAARAGEARARELAAVLTSDSDALAKSRACKDLAALGDASAVPALAALLGDPQLAAYARTALEGIADPRAGDALLEALARLEGDLRIGVVNSLGVRRDVGAIPALGALAREADAEVAAAALAALGRIATPEATALLARVLRQGPDALTAAAADACLVAAESLARRGETQAALDLYRRIRRSPAPRLLRLAATGREMVALGAAGASMVARYARSSDPATRATALRAAREVPGPEITRALIGALAHAGPDAQVAIIAPLAVRKDPAARDAILALLASSVRKVRLAALRALGTVDPARVPFVPLFDGTTFEGWEGDTAESFRIQNGAIVGGSLTTAVRRNEFLCTTGVYGNYILRLECKVVSANGGVQFRSQRVPDSAEVSGYQADMDSSGTYWGCLYDESRRGMLVEADRTETARVVKADDWNGYEIRCEGPRIQLLVNGARTVDYMEADASIPRTGVIAVQVHAGPPSETWYRNIEIAELP